MTPEEIMSEIAKLSPADVERLKEKLRRKPHPKTSVPGRRIRVQEPPEGLTRNALE